MPIQRGFEKPLARTADESYDVWQRVAATGVKHMCAFTTGSSPPCG
jgi:predicted dehydrogenase